MVRRAGCAAAVTIVSSLTVVAGAPDHRAQGATPARVSARTSASATTVVGAAPAVVTHDSAVAVRAYDARASLALNLGLPVRHSTELDAVIRAASTPGSPEYGHYLTPAQYDARYAPTAAEVAGCAAGSRRRACA